MLKRILSTVQYKNDLPRTPVPSTRNKMCGSLTNRLHKIIATAYLLCDAQPFLPVPNC